MTRIFVAVISALCFLQFSALAYKGPTSASSSNNQLKAASCAPATAIRDMQWNNVRARLENAGSMWQDRATSSAAYEVPAGGGVSSIYAGGLWMGGISQGTNQLKLAAVTFRANGNDFWPGPLTTDGTAEVSEETCVEYDKFFVTTRQESVMHAAYFEALANGNVDEVFPDGYVIPSHFADYPAHGNGALGQDNMLAPFYDVNENDLYEPEMGDYPWYDFLGEIDCETRQREDEIPLFGDQTIYWIFNDKGNIHTESGGEPIGMEIRAQAFAFNTTDEINNMTFYNYVLINQGTQTLEETYFGKWTDADLGTSIDDYVGCDVSRGMGYCYNGDGFDEVSTSSNGYGDDLCAIGVDFFEGPYQDSDDLDNPLTENILDAQDSLGIPYKGIGIGYGDEVIDNERFGMRRFVYYNNSGNPLNGEPGNNGQTPGDFYNYMRGLWKNGQKMTFGGDGLTEASGTDPNIPADYMFPGDTDPLGWGTNGQEASLWTEQTAGNPPADRRFIQAAGPFTLEPGDYNNITVGVVWAEATSSDPFSAVVALQEADDKAQALFDNCFEILSGPEAPDVAIQELDQELILYLSGTDENFREEDPTISEDYDQELREYAFQGYMIYQLADNTVSAADLYDIDKSRLVAIVDVQDSISQAVNYVKDPDMGLSVPFLMADGENSGIRHSFRITQDLFAQGSNNLVNHKTYYFMAIAYAFNNYEEFNPVTGSGQDVQFLPSRRSRFGEIISYTGIPHKPSPEAGGTIMNAQYGDGVEITRWYGQGNGDMNMDITLSSEKEILEEFKVPSVTYKAGAGPVEIQVIDPLNIPAADFTLRLAPDNANLAEADSAYWVLTNETMLSDATSSNDEQAIYDSQKAISVLNEDILLDWGISITWNQEYYSLDETFTEPLESSIEFDDPSRPWLLGVNDAEGFEEQNWIRAGIQNSEDGLEEEVVFDDMFEQDEPVDEAELYEGILGGTWAPYALVSATSDVVFDGTTEEVSFPAVAPTISSLRGSISSYSRLANLNNVDVVLTSDTSLWTRCPVIEMQALEDLADKSSGEWDLKSPEKMLLRRAHSVDKMGLNVNNGGDPEQATMNGSQPYGMGWFPGYAIDIGTGERLNMAFGEDSWLSSENGNDMIFNPSSRIQSELGTEFYAGGQHWIYVFKNGQFEENRSDRMPVYDGGKFLYEMLEQEANTGSQRRVFRSCTWVGSSLLNDDFSMLPIEEGLIPNDVRIRLRVSKAYSKYTHEDTDWEDEVNYDVDNNNFNPYYTFSTRNVATQTEDVGTLEDALSCINVVPNPYYAYSQYETSKLDNRVKITNLPEVCTVSIYNINGTLVRQYGKADELTSVDWDLKNEKNIPIAGGVYLIHVDVPNVGETVLKWFGVMRPVDLDNF